MSYRVVVTARARADAVEALRWLAERSPDNAARWYADLEKAIAKLLPASFVCTNPVGVICTVP